MNHYGTLARNHWTRHAPDRLAALADPDAHFEALGQQIQEQVTALADQLAGPDPAGEDYLTKTGRLNAARRQAEEAVLAELLWPVTEPPLAEAREEWEQTRTSDRWLAEWAERIQRHPDQEPATAEVEQLAQEWALTPPFLSGLMTAESPREYLNQHAGILREAANTRFLRQHRQNP